MGRIVDETRLGIHIFSLTLNFSIIRSFKKTTPYIPQFFLLELKESRVNRAAFVSMIKFKFTSSFETRVELMGCFTGDITLE